MGTGLGPESYAIIEQGRIGQILSSKPTDRRAIIEEAAGITKFKTKKRLAEARLEDAKLNLSRINDIFDEVTRQMNSLKRQAAKAERYRQAARRDARQAAPRPRQQVRRTRSRARRTRNAAEPVGRRDPRQIRARAGAGSRSRSERTQRGYVVENEARENRERLSSITRENDRARQSRRRTTKNAASNSRLAFRRSQARSPPPKNAAVRLRRNATLTARLSQSPTPMLPQRRSRLRTVRTKRALPPRT